MAEQQILQWPSGSLDFSGGCIVMGILNVTPDSFSDGGVFVDVDKAVAHGAAMAKAGAAIIDVGPESTRPGSESVSSADQIKRAVPVIAALSKQTDAVISIDTRFAEVAAAAIEAGASIINDVTALGEPAMAHLAVEKQVPVILMHMQGKPATMQQKPVYEDVVAEVADFLVGRAKIAEECGVGAERIMIDPGIGFGKTFEHNIELLRNLKSFTQTGYRVLLGTSRKRFIGQITGKELPADRVYGTAATTALAVAAGVSIVRVHDVAETVDVVKVANQICYQSK
ncbi:MAG: dihydropteroate synthase [Planctomycetes bacterium]|nr:dihydropteroate synthase [Planctomycetota bacterium]